MDDKSQDEQDPIDIHIRNSPIRTLPTQVFGKNRMTQTVMTTTTQTTTQTTPPSNNLPTPTTTKSQQSAPSTKHLNGLKVEEVVEEVVEEAMEEVVDQEDCQYHNYHQMLWYQCQQQLICEQWETNLRTFTEIEPKLIHSSKMSKHT
jgi:hypothetical protein